MVRILAEVICTTLRPEFRIPTDLFLLFAHDHLTKIYGPLLFIPLFCTRPFDQKLGSSLIYVFYVHTTIRSKYVVFLYLLFLLWTTIRPRLRVLTYLFFLFVHNHSTKIYVPLLFILSFVQDHLTKN